MSNQTPENRAWPFPVLFVPDRAFIEALRVGDLAPDCFGKPRRVVRINAQLDDVKGRAFVNYCTEFGPTGSISNSLKEGELHRSTFLTGRHTSMELNRLEARINEEND